jgi:hypothetical protein
MVSQNPAHKITKDPANNTHKVYFRFSSISMMAAWFPLEREINMLVSFFVDMGRAGRVSNKPSITIVRRRENRDDVPILTPIVSVHDKLMCSCDQRQTVVVVECFGDILAECVACSTRTDSPSTSIIGVAPEEITHGSFMGDFLDTVEGSDVVEGVDARRQSSVETKDLVVDECGEGEIVEQVGEIFPDVGVAVFS